MNPKIRRAVAAGLAISACIGWPLTQFTVARNEAPFTLALSWFAIVLTSIDIWATTDVRKKEEDERD